MLIDTAKLLGRAAGWSYENQVKYTGSKSVMIVAPHTTMWDYVLGLASLDTLGFPAKIAIRKEYFRFPMGPIIESLGGISVDRSPNGGNRRSGIDSMVDLVAQHDEITLVITPEGTRSKTHRWRTGFYHVAERANIPILLGYLDYRNRRAIVGDMVHPSGNMEADLRLIMRFYAVHGVGKHAEQFNLDQRFV